MGNTTKIALVTGGSRGLGRNSAIALSKKGIDVIVTYNKEQELADSVVHEIESNGAKGYAMKLDAGDVSSFEAFRSQLQAVLKEQWNRNHIDFLVNNAGFGINAPIADTTVEQFDSLMNVHFKGVFFLTQTLLPVMNDHGGIVNISTGLTRFSMKGSAAYAAMKGAIEVLTKYMAQELGERGIRVNVVAPGAIATDFGGGRIKSNQNLRDHIGSITALGRAGEADDIGGVVAALCTPELAWVNAQRIEASGGMLL